MIFTGSIGETGGARNLTKAGTTTVILAGANNYSGTTTITGGTLQIGGGTTSGTLGTGPVVNNSNLVFNRTDTVTVANANSGTGSLFHAGSGTTLLTGALTYTGITQVDAGRLQLGTNLTTSPTVNINNGARLEIASPRGKVLNTRNLNISAGSTLDMNDNDAVVDYTGGSPFATIQSQIVSGYNGGAWNGTGITSTAAANNNAVPGNHITALGYGEALAVLGSFPGTFSGQTINDDAVLIRYTYSGDANMDGSVDTVDFNILASNFSQSSKNWTDGDFNYDTVVDTVDFSLLASNFGQTLPAASAASSLGSVGALVPEPGFAGLATIIGGMLIARRRRRI
jgi:autotransporter-associated beta strand protein